MPNQPPFGCHNMQPADPEGLCKPLRRLMEEHESLRKTINDLSSRNEIPLSEKDEERENLREDVGQFMTELETHSNKEEEWLFPVMAQYIGKETGPIAVMEYEHEQAKKHLHNFFDGAETTSDEASECLRKGLDILREHFQKEERILFPMAERLLSDEEKRVLESNVC